MFCKNVQFRLITTGKPYWRGRLSAVDLLVLTSLYQLLLIMQSFFKFLTKQGTLMWRSTVLSLSPQLVFPDYNIITNTFVIFHKIKVAKQIQYPCSPQQHSQALIPHLSKRECLLLSVTFSLVDYLWLIGVGSGLCFHSRSRSLTE